jgi:polar amino acid transport system substrate-binding protein
MILKLLVSLQNNSTINGVSLNYILGIKMVVFINLFFNVMLFANNVNITTDEWYPYTKKDKSGIIDQIVVETLNNSDKNFIIKYNSFDDGYKLIFNKQYDATYPYFYTKDRSKDMLYSKPLFDVENVLFYNKEKFNNDLENIYDYRIGFVKGYTYKNIDMRKFKNIIYLNNELIGFDMLNKGELDLLPSNKLVGIHFIKKYFNDFYTNIDYIRNKNFITTDSLYFLLVKNNENQEILKRFNNSLEELKKDGKYKEIILKNHQLINANLANEVKLVNNTESFPIVIATDSLNSKEQYMLPRGTKAIVLQWSKHFKEKGNLKIYDEMFKKTKVKIINGPLKGKVLFVENMYIEID